MIDREKQITYMEEAEDRQRTVARVLSNGAVFMSNLRKHAGEAYEDELKRA